MIFSYEDLIGRPPNYTLRKGDLIYTGTPVALARSHRRFIGRFIGDQKCLAVKLNSGGNSMMEKNDSIALSANLHNRSKPGTRYYQKPQLSTKLFCTSDGHCSTGFGIIRRIAATHFHGGDIIGHNKHQYSGACSRGRFCIRVRVQIGGGGNYVYIDHPNVYTSVYMHLESFNSDLAKIVKDEQYKPKRFGCRCIPETKSGSCKKGEFIAKFGQYRRLCRSASSF